MSDKLVCPICGAPTRTFMGNARKDRLCAKHAEELKAGKLVINKNGEFDRVNSNDEAKTKENKSKNKQVKEYTELPSEGFDKCVICNNKTNGYAFCKSCWERYDTEEMLNILNNRASEENKKAEAEVVEELNKVVVIDENNKSRCITCGKSTDGLLFCSSCYYKYKNKELLFRITHCANVELLDEDYEGRFTCKDGHIVKSKSEREIDNYLFEHGIPHAYEKDLAYGADEKEVLHPDFYLPDYLGKGKHVYIEHWGYNENNIQYTKTKKFKLPIYKNLKITLICTYEKTDTGKIDAVLDRKLKPEFIKENQINFEEN